MYVRVHKKITTIAQFKTMPVYLSAHSICIGKYSFVLYAVPYTSKSAIR
jgi:hypothetical protein